MTSLRVLVADDERNIRTTLRLCLEGLGCVVEDAASADAALTGVDAASFDLAFVDLRLGEASGMDLLPKLLAVRPELRVVIITAYATYATAVEAMKRGAFDYLPKPFTPAQVGQVVEKVRSHAALSRRLADVEARLALEVPEADLGSDSPAMQSVMSVLTRAAPSGAPVLLRGENGTGKGVLARRLHAQGPRRDGPFVTVNCPTLTDELLASELFGHTRGAFTGAVRDQPGRVEAAEGGTLFLDEIGEISPALQAKLLRFLQDHQFERVGETRTRRADVRLVAATNRNLEEDVRAGRFREDLLYRINVVEVRVPPLRERREDILRLANRFLDFFARAAGRAPLELTPEAQAALTAYDWPGNVRELRNTLERTVILWPARQVTPDAFPDRITPAASPARSTAGAELTLEALERAHILAVLRRAPSREEAARILGIDLSTLWRKRKKYEEEG